MDLLPAMFVSLLSSQSKESQQCYFAPAATLSSCQFSVLLSDTRFCSAFWAISSSACGYSSKKIKQKMNMVLKQCGGKKWTLAPKPCIVLSFSTQIVLGFCSTWYGALSITNAGTCLLKEWRKKVEKNTSAFFHWKLALNVSLNLQFLAFYVH